MITSNQYQSGFSFIELLLALLVSTLIWLAYAKLQTQLSQELQKNWRTQCLSLNRV